MKKYITAIFLILTACGQTPEKPAEQSINEVVPTVMVKGQYYYSTGKESDISARCGVMDGEITSSVKQYELPNQNDESNFGSGYGYQYGIEEGQIEIYINEKWMVFQKEESSV